MKKRIMPLLLITVLVIGLVGVLSGCEMYVQHTAKMVRLAVDDDYDDNEKIIVSGDSRKFEIITSDGIVLPDSDHKDFTFVIDHTDTIYEIGDITIDGRMFVVPADTLDTVVSVDVMYNGDHFSDMTIKVTNMSIESQHAKTDREEYYNENVDCLKIEDYYFARDNGLELIAGYNDEILKYEEEIAKLDPESESYAELIEEYERYISWNLEEIKSMEQEMADAPAYIKENEERYLEFYVELDRFFSIYHEQVKGENKV